MLSHRCHLLFKQTRKTLCYRVEYLLLVISLLFFLLTSFCGTHGRGEKSVQCFGEKARKKESLGKPRRRWENGIRMDLRDIDWGGVDWIRLAQDRDRRRAVVYGVMNLRVLAPWS
jgi:hypothetical protein